MSLHYLSISIRAITGVFAFLCLISCEEESNSLFRSLPPGESGISFANDLESKPELNILNYLYYYNGGGVAVADINQDSLPDIYLTANQGPDALYLNLGGLKFRDITTQAGISNAEGWTTGVTHADVNADGLIDFYISKVGAYGGHNLLYLNKGNDENGIPRFEEASARYHLDLSTYATQAAFFDYDNDGDLDLFQLNHSTHPNRNYGKGEQRKIPDPNAGDLLLENRDGIFTDVSAAAGIFQGRIGYGLGLGISDLDGNGFPDIYVGNDFFENDYLYLNQGDGSFREVISYNPDHLGHTSHFSMGNEIADMDNDGRTDIISLDMLPEDLQTFKTSGTEYPFPTYAYYLKNGYAPQYMQNTLHHNLGNGNFSEVAHLSGIAATEWSWAPLAADFDNDGDKDLFITNGIKGATNDMDFINFIANEEIQRRIDRGMINEDLEFIKRIPPKKVSNTLFRNTGGLRFEKAGKEWFHTEPSFSNGAAYADFDRDGDLDLLINNVDAPATLLENTSNSVDTSSFLQVSFKGPPGNPNGIGAKVLLYNSGETQFQENFPTRGYLSTVPPVLHFGLPDSKADSLKVIWPGGKTQLLTSLKPYIVLDYTNAKAVAEDEEVTTPPVPLARDTVINLGYRHQERTPLDFNRTPLAPFAYSNEGPSVTVFDANGDGLDDLFLGGAKGQPGSLYYQQSDGSFLPAKTDLFIADKLSEDTDHIAADVDNNGYPDLLVVSGGNEARNGPALRPRLYLNHAGKLQKDSLAFRDIELNASSVSSVDIENDGDLDILLTADATGTEFGKSPNHFLMINDGKGNFREADENYSLPLTELGQVSDARWEDMDGNGYTDLIVAGDWSPIQILYNSGKGLQKKPVKGLQDTHGWWNTVRIADINGDRRPDIIAGNWGLNTRLRASTREPITLYRKDFDGNGTIDPVVTYYHKGQETPLASKDELSKQMPFLNKKFLSYADFAKAEIQDLFGQKALVSAETKTVYELRHMVYLQESDGSFTPTPLPHHAQASSVHAMMVEDLDGDGVKDLLLAGNTFEISTQLGRIDASHGLFLQGKQDGTFRSSPQSHLDIQGAARDIGKIKIGKDSLYVVTINNGEPVFLSTNQN